MGFLSVALNIFTLLVVAVVFYTARNLYRTVPDKSLTASQAFNEMWIEPSTVTHSFFNEAKYGPMGHFVAANVKKSNLELTTVEG